jgi:hypothetical protein
MATDLGGVLILGEMQSGMTRDKLKELGFWWRGKQRGTNNLKCKSKSKSKNE